MREAALGSERSITGIASTKFEGLLLQDFKRKVSLFEGGQVETATIVAKR